jgi:hypothetical protein
VVGARKGIEVNKARMLWTFGLAAIAALIVVAPSGATPAGQRSAAQGRGVETATFEGGRRNLQLVVPRTVKAGDVLRVENLTNPKRIGPHTFSLVTKDSLPTTGHQQRRCRNFKGGTICRDIAQWHKVNFRTGELGVNPVEVGKKGWDHKGNTSHRRGDSWFTDKENQRFSQKVSADAGKTLYVICAIHPELQDKFKVVNG